MKFKMKFSVSVYVLIVAVMLISVASIVLDALILSGKGGFMQGNVVVTSLSTVCASLLFATTIALLFNSKYSFSKSGFAIIYGVVPKVVPYENVLAAAIDKNTNKLYLQYKDADKKTDFSVLAVNVDEKFNDTIVSELEKRNDNFKRLNSEDDENNA